RREPHRLDAVVAALLPGRRRPARDPGRRRPAGDDRAALGPHAVQQLARGRPKTVGRGYAPTHATAGAGKRCATPRAVGGVPGSYRRSGLLPRRTQQPKPTGPAGRSVGGVAPTYARSSGSTVA